MDYPGYRVSRDGRVESCWTRRGRYCIPTDNWRPLKPIFRSGYPTVNLPRGGKKTICKIHRLVLEVFVGPCPEGCVACHNDGNRANNDLSNLRWDTPRANSSDSLCHGTRVMGSRCRSSKLTEGDVVQIRRMRIEGTSIGELAKTFGVTYENVLAIVNRRSWRHLPELQPEATTSAA
ncbi:MAG TPA: HNH endonuclease [Isosphaeraceae bacterium]|nr:HNH endonuclease [Isosphaeraceae bacterium]